MKGSIVYSDKNSILRTLLSQVTYKIMFDGNKKKYQFGLPKDLAIFDEGDRVSVENSGDYITIKKIKKE